MLMIFEQNHVDELQHYKLTKCVTQGHIFLIFDIFLLNIHHAKHNHDKHFFNENAKGKR